MKLKPVEEDILFILYKLERDDRGIKIAEVVKNVNVSQSKVSLILKELSEKGLVVYTRYKSVRLTDTGRKVAAYLVRRHRVLERFLSDILKYDSVLSHVEAHRLEHSVSREFVDRLDSFLKYPAKDPHGNPIPREGMKYKEEGFLLSEANEGDELMVVAILDESPDFLKRLIDYSIYPGAKIKVLSKPPFGAMAIKIGDTNIAIDLSSAGKIRVKKV